MKHQRGLILIELIAVIVLTGIIATFTSFFLYTGIHGYLNAKSSLEGALKAQMALDRMTLELRNISYFTSAPTAASVSYVTKDPLLQGVRVLKYQSGTDTGEILISVDGTDYPLLDNVSAFDLNFTYQNLNNDPSTNEVAAIKVGFNVAGVGKEFKTQIFPRNLVEEK
jgi:type II secretory pathway pseudopilin PulG